MKKLLLILLCLPIIGFGQDDKIIFISGDTIIGNVIEVGVKDITYQHKNETTDNISKKRELAKIIYSSGRIEKFKGISTLKSKIEKEENKKVYLQKKEENKKVYLQKEEERRLIQKNYKKLFEIGGFFGASYNNNTTADYEKDKHITTIEGLILKYNFSSNYKISLQINYHITGFTIQGETGIQGLTFGDMIDPQYGFIFPTDKVFFKLSNHYISMPIAFEYSFYAKPKLTIKAGAYSSYLIKSIKELNYDYNDYVERVIITGGINAYDYGAIFGIGLSYPINNKFNLLFDYTSYYGLKNYLKQNLQIPNLSKSKNRTATAIIGLTYNLKNK